MSELSPAALRGAVDLSSLANRAAKPGAAVSGSASGAVAGGSAEGHAAGEAVAVPSLVLDVTDSTFPALIELSSTVPVIVDLWAEWCGPCKQLTPVLERLVTEYAGRFLLAKVDVDANPQLAQAFQAQSIPTVVGVIGGRPIALFAGALPEAEVRQVLEQVLQLAEQNGVSGRVRAEGQGAAGSDQSAQDAAEPELEPLPPLHQEAYDAIEHGDYSAAVAAFETAIKQSPSDRAAVAGLAQVRLLERLKDANPAEVREAAATAPDDVAAQLRVADLDVSGGHLDDAFDRLLTLFSRLDEEGRAVVRERLLELFEVAGSDDARVVAARRRLSGLLF